MELVFYQYGHYSLSTTIATAYPPPKQSDASPQVSISCFNQLAIVSPSCSTPPFTTFARKPPRCSSAFLIPAVVSASR